MKRSIIYLILSLGILMIASEVHPKQDRLPIDFNSKLDPLSTTLEMSRNAKINLYEAYSIAKKKNPNYTITRFFL